MSNLTRELADWAASLQYKQLPTNVVQAAKRMLLDALGCALAGVRKPECATVLQYIRDLGGKPSCGLIGTADRTTSPLAAFYNSLAIRALDFNDVYWHCDPCHPSDIIPAALSICEERSLNGKSLIVGIVVAYEIQMRLCESAYPGIRERGWHHATFTAMTSAIVAARMLGLSTDNIASAAGIAASHSATFGVVTAGELTAMKNAADPMAVEAGVRAAMLAERGFGGPIDVLGGKEGVMHSLGRGWQPERIVADLGKKYRILQCTLKAYPVEALIQSPLTAMLHLVAERKIDPDDVREIFVDTIPRAVELLADPAKYAPTTPETADHSLPYCLAVALIDGRVTLEQFSPERLNDPQVERLMKVVRVVGDARLEQRFPITQPCRVGVATAKGESFSTKVDVARGHPLDPMTDEEVLGKFETLAGSVLETHECELLRQVIASTERLEDASDLADMLVAVRGADAHESAKAKLERQVKQTPPTARATTRRRSSAGPTSAPRRPEGGTKRKALRADAVRPSRDAADSKRADKATPKLPDVKAGRTKSKQGVSPTARDKATGTSTTAGNRRDRAGKNAKSRPTRRTAKKKLAIKKALTGKKRAPAAAAKKKASKSAPPSKKKATKKEASKKKAKKKAGAKHPSKKAAVKKGKKTTSRKPAQAASRSKKKPRTSSKTPKKRATKKRTTKKRAGKKRAGKTRSKRKT